VVTVVFCLQGGALGGEPERRPMWVAEVAKTCGAASTVCVEAATNSSTEEHKRGSTDPRIPRCTTKDSKERIVRSTLTAFVGSRECLLATAQATIFTLLIGRNRIEHSSSRYRKETILRGGNHRTDNSRQIRWNAVRWGLHAVDK
jgi:hypothetical protein